MSEKVPAMVRVDLTHSSFHVFRDLRVEAAARQAGPPQRIDGMTLGIVTMDRDAPHGGEMHPDGDEILCVISRPPQTARARAETVRP